MATITNQSSIVFYSGRLRKKIQDCENSINRGDRFEVRENLLNEIKELEKKLENLQLQVMDGKTSR